MMTQPPTSYHVPVLLPETVALLLGAPAGPIVDGTLGGGGHTAALVDGSNGTRVVLGLDQDPDARAASAQRFTDHPHREHIRIVAGNFRDIRQLLADELGPDAKVAGVLLDLGVSSHQLDASERGFGIRHLNARLDMRMTPDHTRPTARELIASATTEELARILHEYGEVPASRTMATRLQEAAARGRLETIGELVAVVDTMRAAFRKLHVHPATLVAQALRIAVNDELGALEEALADIPHVLMPGGRLVVMSYHSLEDRRVKTAFLRGANGPERPARLPPPSDWRPTWEILTHKALTARDAEIAANPRARSAKLRAAARTPFPPEGGAR